MKRLLRFLLPVIVLAAGCTTTKDIHENPADYAGQRVVLSGEMSKRIPIPFTDLAVFVFTDDYGSAMVLSAKEHTLKEPVMVYGKVAVFPEKGATKEMSAFVKSVSDFLVENGWAEPGNADTLAGGVIKVFSVAMKGLGKVFIILEN